MQLIKKKKNHPTTILQYYQNRNKILIIRKGTGAGDILMHRMMFEDIKSTVSGCKVVFACHPTYFDLVSDHPYIDEIIDYNTLDLSEYPVRYDTSIACSRYETTIAPLSGAHRSDIWAAHCGLKLTHHNMHIHVTEEEKSFGTKIIRHLSPDPDIPVTLLCPKSTEELRNLNSKQLTDLVEILRSKGSCVIGCHQENIPILSKMNVPVIKQLNVRQWIGLMKSVNYCVSVDTSHFHLAGGLGIPLLGIFTYVDGKVRGRYFEFELVQKHRDNGDWDCGPCYNWSLCPKTKTFVKPCLTEITPGMLIDGVDRLFRRWPWKSKNTYPLSVIG